MVKAIIFDMDGVIIDTEPLADNYFIKYFKKINLEINKAILKTQRGVNSETFWTNMKELYNLPKPADFYVQDFRYDYIEYLKPFMI